MVETKRRSGKQNTCVSGLEVTVRNFEVFMNECHDSCVDYKNLK